MKSKNDNIDFLTYNINMKTPLNTSNINNKTYLKDLYLTIPYKKYFKTYIQLLSFKKNSHNQDELNKLYMHCRSTYQSYMTNKKYSHGLKLKGSKAFEKLPLDIFNNHYIMNTSDISKELQNEVLQYFFPFPENQKLIEENQGKKIKLTPIPYKNKNLIRSQTEKYNILQAKSSAILMRRVEYTHLIKKHKLKKIDNSEQKREIINKLYI